MEKNTVKRQYQEHVKQVTPKANLPLNMAKAFLIGGLICVLGQFILNTAENMGLDETTSASWCSLILILLSVVLTGLGLFSKLASFGGAGALVPITGFANGIASSAVEFQADERDIIGLSRKAP